jgi:hypothetical protein
MLLDSRNVLIMGVAILGLVGAPIPAVADNDDDSGSSGNWNRADRCEAALEKAAGDYSRCLLRGEAQFTTSGNENRLHERRVKCGARFDRRAGRAIWKYGEEYCAPDFLVDAIKREVAGSSQRVVTAAFGSEPPGACQYELSYLGSGYNEYFANPFPIAVPNSVAYNPDTGWTRSQPVFAADGCDTTIADYTITPSSSTSASSKSEAVRSSFQWQSQQTRSFSVGGGVPKAASGTAGGSFGSASSQFAKQEYDYQSFTWTQGVFDAQIDSLEASMPLNPGFINAVQALPPEYVSGEDPANYNVLLTNFGTAVATQVSFGGYWVETYEFGAQSYGAASSDSSSFNAGLKASDGEIQGNGDAKAGSSASNQNSMAGYVQDIVLNVVGGIFSPGNTPLTQWVDSLNNANYRSHLMPITFELTQFGQLTSFLGTLAVAENFCPEAQTAQAMDDCMDEFTGKLEGFEAYLEDNACNAANPSAIPPTILASTNCTTAPSTTTSVYTPAEPADVYSPPTNAKRSMSINFKADDYFSAISYCYTTSVSITHGNEEDGQNCYLNTNNAEQDGSFGPNGQTSDCYIAMKSDGHGIDGSASFKCVHQNSNFADSTFTFNWGLPEDLPGNNIDLSLSPASAGVVLQPDGNCTSHCAATVSITSP